MYLMYIFNETVVEVPFALFMLAWMKLEVHQRTVYFLSGAYDEVPVPVRFLHSCFVGLFLSRPLSDPCVQLGPLATEVDML